ncbi:hypothetical protein EJ04DRAFT_256079 [Polyplosphaeria fusca]|uniref:Uncharacterized protein n=1 Tax=Polyplosphaeria fusca TaxID=682080 RepID=A0A9P4V2A3_9PLEO|nr:hypothetical protein EJ04DRAFT_256079 [Polyplosphaeria fusca]
MILRHHYIPFCLPQNASVSLNMSYTRDTYRFAFYKNAAFSRRSIINSSHLISQPKLNSFHQHRHNIANSKSIAQLLFRAILVKQSTRAVTMHAPLPIHPGNILSTP